MKNVTSMLVNQARIFAPDVVPLRLIVTPFGTAQIKQALGFREAAWNQETWDYVFYDGTIESETEKEGSVIPVAWASFNYRRIAIQVHGDSAAAHKVYNALSAALANLAPDFDEAHPLILHEETSCVAQLDFEWTALLNPALVQRVTERVRELTTDRARMAVKGVGIQFTLSYTTTDERLREYGVALTDQTIAVEPRADVPLAERRYFTYSPSDSETHLRLVRDLEASLSKPLRKRGAR